MSLVTLSREEKLELKEYAIARNGSKRPEASRRKSGGWKDDTLDYVGLLGEAAAARLFNTLWDRSIGPGDGGVDIRVAGVATAVKTNHRAGGYLMVERLSDLDAVDQLVLVNRSCDPPRVCRCREDFEDPKQEVLMVVGILGKAEFLKQARESNWGLGPRWWVPAGTVRAATVGLGPR